MSEKPVNAAEPALPVLEPASPTDVKPGQQEAAARIAAAFSPEGVAEPSSIKGPLSVPSLFLFYPTPYTTIDSMDSMADSIPLSFVLD